MCAAESLTETDASLILNCGNQLGESVVWDAARGKVRWVDIEGCEIWEYDPVSGEVGTHVLPERVGAIGLRARGGLVVALAQSFALFDLDTERLVPVNRPVEADLPTTRLNDGRVDRQGRFICGGLNEATDQAAIAGVYRLDADQRVSLVMERVACANSICFSPDGRTMYFADTPTRQILAYEYDTVTGMPRSGRVFAEQNGRGAPDGSIVDSEGCLWNAEWGGGRVVRYSPDGRVNRIVHVPVTNPTCVAFGGHDGDTLFITTARHGLTTAQLADEPTAGGLYAVDVGVRGIPEPLFAG